MAATELMAALKGVAEQTEQYMKAYTRSLADSPAKLTECVEYSLFGPGKRVRPALAIFCSQAVGGTLEQALPCAAAVEMIHCFSLIHDDMPAMDNDDLRRGRPTNHKVYGEAMAILGGDALNTMAFELLAKNVADPKLAITLIKELALATGPEGMIGGQVLDTCHPDEAKNGSAGNLTDLQRIHRMKTGALIKGACRMGALAGGANADQMKLIDSYGTAIGLAFQIMDDILDVTSTTEQMGKRTQKDAGIGKLTYPGLVGLEKSREYLAQQVKVTDEVTGKLGSNAAMLRELSRYMAERTN